MKRPDKPNWAHAAGRNTSELTAITYIADLEEYLCHVERSLKAKRFETELLYKENKKLKLMLADALGQ